MSAREALRSIGVSINPAVIGCTWTIGCPVIRTLVAPSRVRRERVYERLQCISCYLHCKAWCANECAHTRSSSCSSGLTVSRPRRRTLCQFVHFALRQLRQAAAHAVQHQRKPRLSRRGRVRLSVGRGEGERRRGGEEGGVGRGEGGGRRGGQAKLLLLLLLLRLHQREGEMLQCAELSEMRWQQAGHSTRGRRRG